MELEYFIGLNFRLRSEEKGNPTMLHRVIFGLCVLSAFSLGVASAPAAWTVVDLGVSDAGSVGNWPFNGHWSAAINNHGNVAFTLGNEEEYEHGDTFPASYFYNKSAQATVPLGNLGYPWTCVFGINDNNIAVGESVNLSQNDSFPVAMAWKWNGSTGGTMVSLYDTLGPSTIGSSAWGINKYNQVTGVQGAYTGNEGYPSAYVADVTHSFDSTPSTTVKWLSFSAMGGAGSQETMPKAMGFRSTTAVVWWPRAAISTTNGYYDGGDVNDSGSYAKPMESPSAPPPLSRASRRPSTTPAMRCVRLPQPSRQMRGW